MLQINLFKKKQFRILAVLALLFVVGALVVTRVSAQLGVDTASDKSGQEIFIPDLDKTVSVQGQNITKAKPSDIVNQTNIVDTGVDCFDYYQFQSVQVSLDARQVVYKPDDKRARFFGSLVNENNQPVNDGNIFVRIVRQDMTDTDNHDVDIVDEFIGLDKLSLQAKETKQVGFSWNIPEGITGGDYRANFFFSVGKKFNLGGLPFSNEVIIGFTDFKIEADNDKYIQFDRDKTIVNGEEYHQIGNWPTVEPGQEVKIVQEIINTYLENKSVDIDYDLYYWDSLHPRDLIGSQKESITIPANSRQKISYTIPKVDRSVYYLRITARFGSNKSIINIRIVSPLPSARLNYPAITKFPLRQGDKATLFSCFHNTSATSSSGRLVVSLYDQDGQTIKEFDYQGEISSTMMADKVDFTASKNYDYLRLVAKLYNDQEKVIDQYSAVYDCEMFGTCQNPSKTTSKTMISVFSNKLYLTLVVFMGLVTVVIVLMFVWLRRR